MQYILCVQDEETILSKLEASSVVASSESEAVSVIINSNNNNHDNVYGAVIMIKVIARDQPIHLINVD